MTRPYLINLDRSPNRLSHMTAQLNALNIPFVRIPAYDGQDMSDQEFHSFCSARPQKKWQRGQAGCLLSHFAVYRMMIERDEKFGVIFEDDIHLSPDIVKILDDLSWIPPHCGIVRLEPTLNPVKLGNSSSIAMAENRKLCPIIPVKNRMASPVGTGGYIIRKSAAKLILDLPTKRQTNQDWMLFSHYHSDIVPALQIHQVCPGVCVQDRFYPSRAEQRGFGSIIESEPPSSRPTPLQKLCEFKRMLNGLFLKIKGCERVPYAD